MMSGSEAQKARGLRELRGGLQLSKWGGQAGLDPGSFGPRRVPFPPSPLPPPGWQDSQEEKVLAKRSAVFCR